MVLLVAAGLLVRTLWGLQRVNPGFDPKGVTTASLWLPQPNIPENGRYFKNESQVVLFRKILDRVAAIPGVQHAAAATRVPFGRNRLNLAFQIEGRDPERGGAGGAEFNRVSTDYFRT